MKGGRSMRRVLWMVVGFCLASLLFSFRTELQDVSVPAMQVLQPTEETLTLPCKIAGTELTAQNLAVYDGPFMEDGSSDEVIGVTALVLHNDTDTYLDWGEVELKSGETTLCFQFTMLPPDATILIPEKSRSKERPASFFSCSGAVQEMQSTPIKEEKLQILSEDMSTLVLTNLEEHSYADVSIYYKRYDSPSQMFIGGNTYTTRIDQILPGQTVRLSPYRFVKDYSRVVAVIAEKARS